jgi:hypothetical protein
MAGERKKRRTPERRTQRAPSRAYLARATAFAEAIDLAVEVRKACRVKPLPGELKNERWSKKAALFPEPPFANTKSLAYLESAFFTYWNEASGRHVTMFWQHVAKRGLPYKRRDVVAEILARGTIRNDIEYEQVTDAIGDQRFTGAQTKKLDRMLGDFEARSVRRPTR